MIVNIQKLETNDSKRPAFQLSKMKYNGEQGIIREAIH